MEVTRKNFMKTLPLVNASIEKADFLVIDTEFTGLIKGRDVSIFDTPDEYYQTLLNGASDFLLIQFGLCAFYWDEKKKHYMNDAYNFYLFPRGRPGPEKVFLCQSSSLDFLASQGFDFNKLIKEGISYMTEATESRLRDNLIERQKLYSTEKDNISIPEENKQHIEDVCKSVRTFLDEKKEDAMEIERCNAFVRRLLFQELGKRFKNEAFVETKVLENKNRVLKVVRMNSASEAKNKDAQKKEKEWEDFEEAVGFSKVAKMISQSEKLVIGHNMLLDMLHTLNHFFQPLPNDYQSFKEFAHCMFPRLLDTKYMSSLPPFKEKVNSSVLQHLLETLSEAPFSLPKVESEKGRGYTRTDDKQHEAGYDAYVTGLCFLGMQAVVSKMRGDESRRISSDSPALKPFLNKLFLAKTAHQHSPYMNLVGPDPTPPRDHVFHLTFPKEWQRNDINELFSPFGGITVQFMDDTSALVALWRREQARDAMRALAHSKTTSLIPYARYKASMQPEKRRKLSDGPQSISTPDVKPQPVSSSSSSPARARSNSLSVASPNKTSPAANRKRTSSGMFRCDDAEPPPKKIEFTQTTETANKKPEPKQTKPDEPRKQINGNSKKTQQDKDQNNALKSDQMKEKVKDKQKVIQIFDSASKSNSRVTVFKESENWE